MTSDIRGLSFLQPWLWAILMRHKGITVEGRFFAIENRSWKPPQSRVGKRIALHASKEYDKDGLAFVQRTLPLDANRTGLDTVQRGAILGTATLAGAVLLDGREVISNLALPERIIDEVRVSRWSFGAWVWLLADVEPLREAVPCRGALSLWSLPPDVLARVREQEVTCAA